jgi:hypothetical protein
MFKKYRSISSILRVLFFSLVLIAISSGFAFAQTVIWNQAPNQVQAYDSNSAQNQTIADNFIVSSTANVTQIKIWGIYVNGSADGTGSGTDHFTIIFHANNAGLPGATISTLSNVPMTRQLTGVTNVIGSFTEYLFTLTPATPVTLNPGTYWVEIYNDITGSTDHFLWETGTLDPTNGISGSAYSHTVPGSSWSSLSNTDFAIEITKESEPINTSVPTMNEWGMIIFIALAGLGAVYFIRRQRRAES